MSDRRPVIGIAAWRQTVEVWQSKMTIFQIDQAYVERVRTAGGLPFLIQAIYDVEFHLARQDIVHKAINSQLNWVFLRFFYHPFLIIEVERVLHKNCYNQHF